MHVYVDKKYSPQNPNQSKVEQHYPASKLTTPFSQMTDILSSTPTNEKKTMHETLFNNRIIIHK